jgi:hypothetical protein
MNATTTDEDYNIKGQFVAFGSSGMCEGMSLLLQPTQGHLSSASNAQYHSKDMPS